MDRANGADAVDQDRSHQRWPDPARPRCSNGHARRRVCSQNDFRLPKRRYVLFGKGFAIGLRTLIVADPNKWWVF